MKAYYIIFYNGNEKICGTWKRANNKEDACLMAEFGLICQFPNVKYTGCSVITEKE